MSQPGFSQAPGWRPQPGHHPAGPRPQSWQASEQPGQGAGPGQQWNQPRPGFPQQPAPYGQGQQFPPPGWQPPQGWQPPPPGRGGWPSAPPPRRKRSPLPFFGLAVLALVAIAGYALASGSDNEDVASDYQNENYAVPSTENRAPEIPMPEYESDIEAWLESNTLYSQQLASPVRCDLEPVTSTLDDDALQSRMRDYVECLTRVWGPALEAAGHVAYQPTLYVYPANGEVTTSCGTQESLNAFYCGADQNLYLAADVLRILPPAEAAAPQAYDLIIAHEYGHAMQGRSGVFAASFFASEDAGNESEAMEVDRRVELQADCFAGAVMDSISESMGFGEAEREAVERISFEIGDDRLAARFDQQFEEGDHGVGENRRMWAARGLTGGPLSACNAFTAPNSEVR